MYVFINGANLGRVILLLGKGWLEEKIGSQILCKLLAGFRKED